MTLTMVVECTSCQSKFRMDPSKIGPKGVRVRCPKCKTVFPVLPPSNEALLEEVLPPAENVEVTQSSPPPPTAQVSDAESPAQASAPSTSSSSLQESLESQEDPWTSVTEDVFASDSPSPQNGQALGRIALQKSNPEGHVKPESSPEPPPPPKQKQVARPLESLAAPTRTRVMYGFLLAFIALAGLILGLAAMGVRPHPKDLSLLFAYGKRQLSPGVHILAYKATLSPLRPGERNLHISGELYNASPEVASSPQLRLEVFTPEGEYQARSIAPCCEVPEIAPRSKQAFSLSMVVSEQPVGSYKVSLEK